MASFFFHLRNLTIETVAVEAGRAGSGRGLAVWAGEFTAYSHRARPAASGSYYCRVEVKPGPGCVGWRGEFAGYRRRARPPGGGERATLLHQPRSHFAASDRHCPYLAGVGCRPSPVSAATDTRVNQAVRL